MTANSTILGVAIPSTSPLFLAGVGVHLLLALVCVASGAGAMLSPKRPGLHPRFGAVYWWSLVGVFATAFALAATRWAEDYHLIVLGAVAVALAALGRRARRRLQPGWARWHIADMGLSYIVMLTAFYVDNGKNLPMWRDLPPIAYWIAPSLIGLPILVFALLRHPLARKSAAPSERRETRSCG